MFHQPATASEPNVKVYVIANTCNDLQYVALRYI